MMKPLLFGVEMTILTFILQTPASPVPPDFTLVFNAVKIAAWIAIAVSLWKILGVIRQFLNTVELFQAEHRMLMDDLWDRHADKKDDFYIAMGREQRKKSFFYNGKAN